jgi:hypothetical protein
MQRRIVRPLILALTLVAALATPALGHVHAISNAQCAPTGVLSGALQALVVGAPGRPAAQIPQTASGRTGAAWTGQGGSFVANGTNC